MLSVLLPYFEDKETAFVISSDFCHWGSAFRYQYYDENAGEIWQSIEKLDRLGASYICEHDAEGFAKYIEVYKNTICGRNCIEVGCYFLCRFVDFVENVPEKYFAAKDNNHRLSSEFQSSIDE